MQASQSTSKTWNLGKKDVKGNLKYILVKITITHRKLTLDLIFSSFIKRELTDNCCFKLPFSCLFS